MIQAGIKHKMLNIPRAGIIGIYHHAQLSGNFSSDDVLGQILLSFFFFF